MTIDVIINEGPIDIVLAAESGGINITLGDVGPMGPPGPSGASGLSGVRTDHLVASSDVIPDISNFDVISVSAIASALTFEDPIGTPTDAQKLIIRIIDAGTPQSLSWGQSFVQGGIPLPTETVAGKWMHMGFVYNQTVGEWMLIAFLTQG